MPPSSPPQASASLWLHGQGPASQQAYQSLAEGPCHLWLPDKLDVTCVFWPLQEPRCCKE